MAKQILVVSTASYRGISILQVADGVMVFLGIFPHVFGKLQEATDYIDDWYNTKKN